MPFLALNGIEIPVLADDGASLSLEPVGADWRSETTGRLRRGVRAFKREWSFKTPPLALADARAYVGLIEGEGEVWSFDGHAWSDAGLAATLAGSLADVSVSPKFGSSYLFGGTPNTFPVGAAQSWTAAVWYYASGWQLYVVRDRAGVRSYTLNASTSETAGTPAFFGASGSSLLLNGGTFDQFIFTPYVWPVAWGATLHASSNAFPLPSLRASGDFAPSAVTVRCVVDGAETVLLADGLHESIAFTVREV